MPNDILRGAASQLARRRLSGFQIRKSRVMHNIVALYGTQAATYIFPLLTIPYLARTLGPYSWGMVALAQAVGLYVSIVVEFGFQFSATRRIARAVDDRCCLGEIVAGVIGAKAVLAVASLACVALISKLLLAFRENEAVLWAGSLSGVGQGFSMLWFYQGIERMKTSAVLDVCGKAAAAAGVFIFVHSRADAWKVLGIQCGCYCAVSLTLLAFAYQEVPFRLPTPAATWQALRESAAMFLFRSAVSLYTTTNALILGSLATPVAVAYYTGAERLTKGALNLINPVSQALYPRLSHLVAVDKARAFRLARASVIFMFFGGVALCVTAFLVAPLAVKVMLGPGYGQAVRVMRVLSLLLPCVAVSNALGIQWMLPLKMDAVFNKIIISAGVLNLALAICWARRWQHIGMAWSAVVSEAAVVLAMVGVLGRGKRIPFHWG